MLVLEKLKSLNYRKLFFHVKRHIILFNMEKKKKTPNNTPPHTTTKQTNKQPHTQLRVVKKVRWSWPLRPCPAAPCCCSPTWLSTELLPSPASWCAFPSVAIGAQSHSNIPIYLLPPPPRARIKSLWETWRAYRSALEHSILFSTTSSSHELQFYPKLTHLYLPLLLKS